MVEAKIELVLSWMTKAWHDLATARTVASSDEELLDTAIFHCQQAAEKAVKGYLVFHDIRVAKTHNIEELLLKACSVLIPQVPFISAAPASFHAGF